MPPAFLRRVLPCLVALAAIPSLRAATPVAAGVAVSLSPASVSVSAGLPANSTFVVTPVGDFSGQVTLSCGPLPRYAACDLSPATLTFAGTSTAAQTRTLAITTNGGASPTLGLLLLPLAGLSTLFALRRQPLRPGVLGLAITLSSAGLLALSGCGAPATNVASGTYSIPVTATPATGTPTTTTFTLIIQ